MLVEIYATSMSEDCTTEDSRLLGQVYCDSINRALQLYEDELEDWERIEYKVIA